MEQSSDSASIQFQLDLRLRSFSSASFLRVNPRALLFNVLIQFDHGPTNVAAVFNKLIAFGVQQSAKLSRQVFFTNTYE